MPTQVHRKIVVELTCPQCHARNPRRVHLCRNCRAELAPFETRKRSRPAARKIARPLARKLSEGATFAHTLAGNLKPQLERTKIASEEILVNEWRALQERWRAFIETMRELTPNLPEVVEWLAQIEAGLIDITGLQMDGTSRSAAGLPLTEEFHWLRERLSQAVADAEQLRKFRRDLDLNQAIDAAVAGLRFIIAAVAILNIALDIADRLNPRKMLRRTLRGEAL